MSKYQNSCKNALRLQTEDKRIKSIPCLQMFRPPVESHSITRHAIAKEVKQFWPTMKDDGEYHLHTFSSSWAECDIKENGECHGCWCPGSLHCHVICRHAVYSRSGSIWITCAILGSENDIKYKNKIVKWWRQMSCFNWLWPRDTTWQ